MSSGTSGVDVPTPVWSALPMTVAWFRGGYALYSTLFALAGSLVSRQEEAQAASTPIVAATSAAWELAGLLYEQVLLRRGSHISWKDALALAGRG